MQRVINLRMEMVHFIPPSQRRLAMLAAQADTAPVIIHGGDGTGKSGIARWIHMSGPRSTKPFMVSKREKSLSSQIMEAQGGTFVVHEIGEWPLGEQKALLKFLNTKTVTGPNDVPMLLNVRIMVTTSQALEGRAQGGLFNAELLKKLNVFRIEMPALAKRTEEFEDIVMGIVGEITRELHKEHLRSLSEEAWERLKEYEWPGNLRELRNVLRVAVMSAAGDRVEETDLPEFGHDRIDFRATREEFEKIYLMEVLRTCNWEIDRTAEMTRTDTQTLLSKIQKYGIHQGETSSIP